MTIACKKNGTAPIVKSPTIYPDYKDSIAPDTTGMSYTAEQVISKINLGWNIGNTLEASDGETSWGNPLITESYVQFVKQSGFNAIRLPCAWDSHCDDKAKAHIDQIWMNRVKEVINYCIKYDMYVILNVHWDGGWLENNCIQSKKDSVNAKQKAFWQQIAAGMRNFDEHLIFASTNEPNTNNSAEQMSVLLSYHQTFVTTIRSTGGKNKYRILVIQGDNKLITLNNFPTDPTPNRMVYEDHNYTPYQFCLMQKDESWGKMFYYWGSGHHSTLEPGRNADYGEESEQIAYFDFIKSKFIDKGIPVIMGEYGAYRRDNTENIPMDLLIHNDAVDFWITFMTKQALHHGVKPFYWDTGNILSRSSNKVLEQRSLDAIISGTK